MIIYSFFFFKKKGKKVLFILCKEEESSLPEFLLWMFKKMGMIKIAAFKIPSSGGLQGARVDPRNAQSDSGLSEPNPQVLL